MIALLVECTYSLLTVWSRNSWKEILSISLAFLASHGSASGICGNNNIGKECKS